MLNEGGDLSDVEFIEPFNAEAKKDKPSGMEQLLKSSMRGPWLVESPLTIRASIFMKAKYTA